MKNKTHHSVQLVSDKIGEANKHDVEAFMALLSNHLSSTSNDVTQTIDDHSECQIVGNNHVSAYIVSLQTILIEKLYAVDLSCLPMDSELSLPVIFEISGNVNRSRKEILSHPDLIIPQSQKAIPPKSE